MNVWNHPHFLME